MYLRLQVWRDFPLSMLNLFNAASLHLRPFHPSEEFPGKVENLSNKKNISEANCECNKHNLSTSKTGLGEGGQTRTGAFQDRYPRPRCLASDNHSGKLRSMNFYTTKKTHLKKETNLFTWICHSLVGTNEFHKKHIPSKMGVNFSVFHQTFLVHPDPKSLPSLHPTLSGWCSSPMVWSPHLLVGLVGK